MSKINFAGTLRLSKQNEEKLFTINEIIEEYLEDGYKLTLRQLYYQLVSRDIIANAQSEYKKLGVLLTKGRMAGVVDWEAIEDRGRQPYLPYWVVDVPDAISDAIGHYRLDRQKGQSAYIEVWVEKDALSGVLRRITNKYHVQLMVNKGYSSCSAMYAAHKRFEDSEKDEAYILYFGDHDPSGLDMMRDINDRLEKFDTFPLPEIRHLGITMEQIERYNPPPNPAKITDTRAKAYIAQYGRVSWEVDALPPKVLNQILEEEILGIIDEEKYVQMVAQEKSDKKDLQRFSDEFDQ